MLYKRPSLRRGGTPTGIETLEPRKNLNLVHHRLVFRTWITERT